MNATITENRHSINVCNRLYRMELSAVVAYQKVLETFPFEPETESLSRLRDEHAASAHRLEKHLVALGGTPEGEFDCWDVFGDLAEAAQSLQGAKGAVWTLIQGEKLTRGIYETALADPEISKDSKRMIVTDLVPHVDRSVIELDALLTDDQSSSSSTRWRRESF